MLTKAVEFLFILLLLAGVPALSFLTTRGSRIRQAPRPALYFSAVLSQWFLAGVGAVVMYFTSQSLAATGFRLVSFSAFSRWAVTLTLISLATMVLILFLERRGSWPEESELVRHLLPETRQEKLWCIFILAPTAALCEEYLYRGLLFSQLSGWFHSVSWSWVISSVIFGLAHVYQGLSGVVRAAVLGALLAYPVVRLGSLYPSMAAHLLIDAVALAWLGPALLRRRPSLSL